jgi:mRNA interferase RelE/StbE
VFDLFYAKSVKKDIKKIEISHLKGIKKEIELLKDFPNVKNLKKLTNHPVADFRLKVGKYRVLFDVDKKNQRIEILKIANRSEVY